MKNVTNSKSRRRAGIDQKCGILEKADVGPDRTLGKNRTLDPREKTDPFYLAEKNGLWTIKKNRTPVHTLNNFEKPEYEL